MLEREIGVGVFGKTVLKRLFIFLLTFVMFFQPYTYNKILAQQPYPYEWYVPKLWSIQKDSTSNITLINGIPFILKNTNDKTTLTRIDRNNGKTIWSQIINRLYYYKTDDGIINHWEYKSLPPIVGGDKLYISYYKDQELWCIDINTGNILWINDLSEYYNKDKYQTDLSSPVPVCDKVLLWVDSNSSTKDEIIICYESQTGKIIWKRSKMPWFVDRNIYLLGKTTFLQSSPVFGNHYVYYSSSRYINCFDTNLGEMVWTCDIDDSPMYIQFIIKDSIIDIYIESYWGSHDCHFFTIDKSNGNLLKKDKISYYPVLCINDSALYNDKKNHIWIMKSKNELKDVWQIDTKKQDLLKPSLYDDKTILFWKKEVYWKLFYPIGVNADSGKIMWQAKGEIEKYSFFEGVYGRFYGYSSNTFVCFGDPAIDYPEPPSRISDSMSIP